MKITERINPDNSAVALTRNGTPILHFWDAAMPRKGIEGAGFPILDAAQHHFVFAPQTKADGGYNHHSKLLHHNGRFYAIWSNHPHGEDGPGQRVLLSVADAPEKLGTNLRELFPPPGSVRPSEESGMVCTAFKLYAIGDRMFALAGLNANMGFTDKQGSIAPVRDAKHIYRHRKGYSPIVREIFQDLTFGPVFTLFDDNLPEALPAHILPAPPPELVATAARLRDRYLSPEANTHNWDWEARIPRPSGIDGARLCEPVSYQAADRRWVMLLRDDSYSHRLYASIRETSADPWPSAEPTDIPDSPSLCSVVRLDDGTILLVGNQTAFGFDNPDNVQHYRRNPLTVSVSSDGYRFDRIFALCCKTSDSRIPDIKGRGKGEGAQYPDVIVSDGVLYVLYSIGKEDIGISWIELAALLR